MVQSPNPGRHSKSQVPPLQVTVAFGRMVHGIVQPPQFLGSVRVSVSQPLVAFRSQSTNPGVQITSHAPAVQLIASQRRPQPPQFSSSVRVSVSAAHSEADLEEGVQVIARVLREEGICRN